MNKIDFALVITVNHANPNGDPNNANRPRTTYDGLGEITDVCIKRKLRNRLLDSNETILVQADNKTNDGFKSIRDRIQSVDELKGLSKEEYTQKVCEYFYDVRAFGQVLAFKGTDNDGKKGKGVSLGIRGPVTIQNAYSLSPISISTNKITKSVNNETKENDGLSSDRMGDKHFVDFGVYVVYGSINGLLSEENNFTEHDAEMLKQALVSLFENDSSSARPDGSMEVRNLYWWKHNCLHGQYSSAKVHRSLKITHLTEIPAKFEDYEISVEPLQDLTVEILDGF